MRERRRESAHLGAIGVLPDSVCLERSGDRGVRAGRGCEPADDRGCLMDQVVVLECLEHEEGEEARRQYVTAEA
jgi:hypothetical protein